MFIRNVKVKKDIKRKVNAGNKVNRALNAVKCKK